MIDDTMKLSIHFSFNYVMKKLGGSKENGVTNFDFWFLTIIHVIAFANMGLQYYLLILLYSNKGLNLNECHYYLDNTWGVSVMDKVDTSGGVLEAMICSYSIVMFLITNDLHSHYQVNMTSV